MTARELAVVAIDAAPPLYERMTVKHGRLRGVSGAGLEKRSLSTIVTMVSVMAMVAVVPMAPHA
jgi:hypothetical protein